MLAQFWQKLSSRRWLPYRFSSQILFLVATSVFLTAFLAGALFAASSIKRSREIVQDQMLFLVKNISSVSAGFMITKDLVSMEDVLKLNVGFSYVDSILVTDENDQSVVSITRVGKDIKTSYERQIIKPSAFDQALPVVSEPANKKRLFSGFFPEDTLEIWHRVGEKTSVGNLRIRYSLNQISESMIDLWKWTLIYVAVATLTVLFILAMLLRLPMRALRNIAEFVNVSVVKSNKQLPMYSGTKEIFEISRALNQFAITIRSHQQSLTDRMAQNQAILDNLADGIVVSDDTGVIRSCNFAARRIFSYSEDEMVGQNVSMLMPELERMQHERYMRQYSQTGRSKVIGVGREVEAQRKDGSIFPADLAISKCQDRGEIIFIGIIRDISERKRLDKLKSEFVATVSHELRTPLTSIHGSLKLLESGVTGELPEASKKMLGLAQKNSSRLIFLINDLLDMEKLAAGKMEMEIARLELIALVEQSLADNAAYADKYKVKYVLKQHPETCFVKADSERLAQVLANLLSNAAKFSDAAPEVEVRVIEQAQFARIEIQDHGAGIPEDFRDKLFAAFSQASSGNTRQQGGTGLGLKISKGLVEAMHGDIGFSSETGKGTIFWCTLPKA